MSCRSYFYIANISHYAQKIKVIMSSFSGFFAIFYKNILLSTIDFLLPARCVVTGEVVETSEMLSPDGWASLNFIEAPYCSKCGTPFGIVEKVDAEMVCAGCLDFPPICKRVRASLRYDDGSRGLILAYKHGDKTHMAIPFSEWLRRAGDEILDEADLLVPVPLHWTRLLRRRYNQAALLAQCLSRKTGVPVNTTEFKRIKKTPPQGYMKKKERRRNVSDAFSVKPGSESVFSGKRIVLIDDVYTSGATVDACAKVLLDVGALSVDVLCVARTVYD